MPRRRSNARPAFLLLVLAQAAHSIEEYAFRLYDVFPPARLLSGLVSADHRIGFIVLNGAFFALGIAVYLALVRPGRPSAAPWMWGWVVVEVANATAHLAITAGQRAYMPGTVTAPVLLVVGLYLGIRLRQESRSGVRSSMANVAARRVTAKIDGDFVVFLIGMRINKPLKVHKWLPVFLAMPRMLRELEGRHESGFLGSLTSLGVIVQYWRSFEQLEAYARDPNQSHWPAWVDFNRRVGGSRGDVGIWHETYRVRAGEYECVYSGMPPYGLAKASATVDAVGHLESARGRFGGR